MTGVALRTLLNAVSPTASVAAFLLFPRLWISKLFPALWALASLLRTRYTSIPFLISSPRIRKTFSAPADATAAKGTRRERSVRTVGDTCFNRGTAALRPRATEQDADTARRYDLARVEVGRGVDLLAFALLMATLRDWLVICQSRMPVICNDYVNECHTIVDQHELLVDLVSACQR